MPVHLFSQRHATSTDASKNEGNVHQEASVYRSISFLGADDYEKNVPWFIGRPLERKVIEPAIGLNTCFFLTGRQSLDFLSRRPQKPRLVYTSYRSRFLSSSYRSRMERESAGRNKEIWESREMSIVVFMNPFRREPDGRSFILYYFSFIRPSVPQ